MTSQSPRIYTYKITFEEVPYYYYGVKKEKYFNEEYWGSPATNKWCWKLYTPKKQILEIFDYTDEGWLEALEIEKRLIKPVYNIDKLCLNKNCGGIISLDVTRKTGIKTYEIRVGIHGRTQEQIIEDSRKGGNVAFEKKLGIHGRPQEQIIEDARKGGKIVGKITGKLNYKNKVGVHGLPKEKTIENAKKGGQKTKELGLGIHSLTLEQRIENGKKGGSKSGKEVSSRKYMCTETGFITNAGNLTKYQKARGINTSKRVRIE
jgi:hypothetical protein